MPTEYVSLVDARCPVIARLARQDSFVTTGSGAETSCKSSPRGEGVDALLDGVWTFTAGPGVERDLTADGRHAGRARASVRCRSRRCLAAE